MPVPRPPTVAILPSTLLEAVPWGCQGRAMMTAEVPAVSVQPQARPGHCPGMQGHPSPSWHRGGGFLLPGLLESRQKGQQQRVQHCQTFPGASKTPGKPRGLGVAASSHQPPCPPSTRANGAHRPFLISAAHSPQVHDGEAGLPATSTPSGYQHTCGPAAASPAPAACAPPRLLQTRSPGSAGAQTAASAGETRRARGVGRSGPCVWGRGEGRGRVQSSTGILANGLSHTPGPG